MGRNPAFERGLKKGSGGGGRSPGEFLGEKGFPLPGQSRFPSVRAFAMICYSPYLPLLADSVISVDL